MTRIALIGPGAVGGTVAAWLAQDAALDVTVCVRTPFSKLTIETPEGAIEAAPRVITSPGQAAPVDWVLIATKAYDAESTALWLPALMHERTRVAVLQNGVEHVARFAAYVDPARIVPAIVDIPAERSAPGVIRQRRFGSILVPETQNGADFAALFARTRIDAATTSDWTSAAWKKLCVNCAGAVFVLTNQPAGVTHRDDIAALMIALMEECAAVGRAEGAKIEPEFLRSIIAGYRDGAKNAITSILADRRAGRQMEIDARNGVIVRLGEKHGIDTPLNNAVTALMSAL